VAAFLIRLVNLVCTLYSFIIIARTFLSWFRIDPYHPVARFLIQATEPVLTPLRQYIPPVGGLDFTPMVALLVIWLVERLLQTLILTVF